MTIKVLFFAQLRDQFGMDECKVDLDKSSTLNDLSLALFDNLKTREGSNSTGPVACGTLFVLARHSAGCGRKENSPSAPPVELEPFLYYAVNEELAESERELNDGDTVAFMTPVSGG